jgi:hypothetical protein
MAALGRFIPPRSGLVQLVTRHAAAGIVAALKRKRQRKAINCLTLGLAISTTEDGIFRQWPYL